MPACNYQLKLPKQTNKQTNEGKKWWQIIRAYLYIRLPTCVRIYLIFFCTRFGIISADPHNLHIKNTITQIWWNLNTKQRAEGKSKYWVDRTLGCRDWCQLFLLHAQRAQKWSSTRPRISRMKWWKKWAKIESKGASSSNLRFIQHQNV